MMATVHVCRVKVSDSLLLAHKPFFPTSKQTYPGPLSRNAEDTQEGLGGQEPIEGDASVRDLTQRSE